MATLPGWGTFTFGTLRADELLPNKLPLEGRVAALGTADVMLFELALWREGKPPPVGIFGSPATPLPKLGAEGSPLVVIEGTPKDGTPVTSALLWMEVAAGLLTAATPTPPTWTPTPNALAVPAILSANTALAV